MKVTKALVVGGAGFIGSHLVDVCRRNGAEVLVYDNFSTGKRLFLPDLPPHQIIDGDILDAILLSDTVKEFNPDVVFHLAAIHHIPTCEKMPRQALRVNVEGTQSVLNACAETLGTRLVFTSTGALYDPTVKEALTENSTIKASDIYSISKLTCENLVSYYCAKQERQAVVARLFNTVGRRETNSHLIPAIMSQLETGNRQIKLGNLTPRRDFIHVEDVAEGLFALGELDTLQTFDIFNVGSGIEYSVQELVNLCADAIGEPIEIISSPELQRKVDRPTQQADSSKLQRTTAWAPSRNLQQALEEIWEENLAKTNNCKQITV